jgi:hypothetical protein
VRQLAEHVHGQMKQKIAQLDEELATPTLAPASQSAA